MQQFKLNRTYVHSLDSTTTRVEAYAVQITILIFFASLFYTLSSTLGQKAFRLAYSALLYSSIVAIVTVYLSRANQAKLQKDHKYNIYFLLLFIFCVCNTIRDFMNPDFSAITLFNNSRALFCVAPILGFVIGYNTSKLDSFHKIINFFIIFFILDSVLVALSEPTTPKVFMGFVLPFTVFNLTNGKYKILSIIILILGAWNSVVVDYRALLLRIIFFFMLFISLTSFKRSSLVKIIIVLVSFVAVYISLTNLTEFLEIFQSKSRISDSMGTDTRTFLYEELFDDLQFYEVIFGRGFLGSYFSPFFLDIQYDPVYGETDSYQRFSIEVGVLELILKGGVIFLILYLMPIIYTVWNGLKNTDAEFKLEYNLCIYLLAELLMFFFENSPSFHIHFFILFFISGYVYNCMRQRSTIRGNDSKPGLKSTIISNKWSKLGSRL